MPGLAEGFDGALCYGLLAAEAGARVVLDEAPGANGLAGLYIEGGLLDGHVAVLAGEVLRVPGLAQGGDDALCDDLVAFVTNGIRHFVDVVVAVA